ncbi:hypothetical protein B7494_g2751 [Chlorociboria aeruginascens]|nr:hypothetical protein B7494_g2751 [Chlorociboria aeruginascens]
MRRADVRKQRDRPRRRSSLSASPDPGRRDDYCPISRPDVGTSVPWASKSLFGSPSEFYVTSPYGITPNFGPPKERVQETTKTSNSLETHVLAHQRHTSLNSQRNSFSLHAHLTGNFYLNGMTQPPCTSHVDLFTTFQTLATYWKMAEREVISHVEGADGTIVNAMENKLLIMLGEDVNGFAECEVTKFDGEGKIKEYLLYCDSAAVKEVFAKAAEKEGYMMKNAKFSSEYISVYLSGNKNGP